MRPSSRRSAALAGLLLALLPGAALTARGEEPSPAVQEVPAAGLTPREAAGKEIYHTGESPSGREILAVLAGGTELPAAALPCSSCHGEDGRGNPEGGISPSDLTWNALTRPYGVRGQGGRRHGPYTPALLKRAIALGVDPAGNELHVAMPRYRMSIEDMEALIAYMRHLGRDRDPGIGEGRLAVGTLLPPPGPLDGVSGALRAVLEAWAEEVNAGGGLYDRKIELHLLTLPGDPAERPAAVARFLAEKQVFALLGAFIAGSEGEITALLDDHRVPLIGPFTLRPVLEKPVNPWVFYLLPGLAVQGRALVELAVDRMQDRETAEVRAGERRDGGLPRGEVVYPQDPVLAEVARAMIDEAHRAGWENLRHRPYPVDGLDAIRLVSTLATVDAEAVFFLGNPRDRQLFLQAADSFNWHPEVYLPGSLAGPQALASPPAFDGRIFLAYPTLPDDRSPEAAEAYGRLAEAHHLPRTHLTTQLNALAAARLFEEGIKRAGRDLSRAKLVAKLERLYKWDSGLTPLLTFTPNRRVGARGAYVVALDLEARTFRRLGGWIEVE